MKMNKKAFDFSQIADKIQGGLGQAGKVVSNPYVAGPALGGLLGAGVLGGASYLGGDPNDEHRGRRAMNRAMIGAGLGGAMGLGAAAAWPQEATRTPDELKAQTLIDKTLEKAKDYPKTTAIQGVGQGLDNPAVAGSWGVYKALKQKVKNYQANAKFEEGLRTEAPENRPVRGNKSLIETSQMSEEAKAAKRMDAVANRYQGQYSPKSLEATLWSTGDRWANKGGNPVVRMLGRGLRGVTSPINSTPYQEMVNAFRKDQKTMDALGVMAKGRPTLLERRGIATPQPPAAPSLEVPAVESLLGKAEAIKHPPTPTPVPTPVPASPTAPMTFEQAIQHLKQVRDETAKRFRGYGAHNNVRAAVNAALSEARQHGGLQLLLALQRSGKLALRHAAVPYSIGALLEGVASHMGNPTVPAQPFSQQ